jgi:hypothetical protein
MLKQIEKKKNVKAFYISYLNEYISFQIVHLQTQYNKILTKILLSWTFGLRFVPLFIAVFNPYRAKTYLV